MGSVVDSCGFDRESIAEESFKAMETESDSFSVPDSISKGQGEEGA